MEGVRWDETDSVSWGSTIVHSSRSSVTISLMLSILTLRPSALPPPPPFSPPPPAVGVATTAFSFVSVVKLVSVSFSFRLGGRGGGAGEERGSPSWSSDCPDNTLESEAALLWPLTLSPCCSSPAHFLSFKGEWSVFRLDLGGMGGGAGRGGMAGGLLILYVYIYILIIKFKIIIIMT